jgi:glutathione S-transferase
MHTLWHFRLCPHSRAVRLALSEIGFVFQLQEERPWEWRPEFLSLNPAGELPVLALADGPIISGAYAITEFAAEEMALLPVAAAAGGGIAPAALFPGNREDRAEVRRLVDWFLGKMHREVSRDTIAEKVHARYTHGQSHVPDPQVLQACRANLRYHMSYIGFLAYQRRWLAGDTLSMADFAAAAQLSCLDYLSEVPWSEYPAAKDWFARIKSRPSLRPLLNERVPGTPPPLHYTNLDF